jgi:Amt family ammonium transporter
VLVSYSLGNSHDSGDFLDGGWIGNLDQAVAIGSVVVFSFVVTFAIVKVIDLVIGLRMDEETEIVGLDQAIYAESAYNSGPKESVVV